MFSTLLNTNFKFSLTFILSSANAFNLDKSKFFLFGKELTPEALHAELNSYTDNVDQNQNSQICNMTLGHYFSVSLPNILLNNLVIEMSAYL